MDLDINTWDITFKENNIDNYDIHSLVNSYFKLETDISYLLNPDLEKYSIIEKIIHNIAMFHFKRLGIEYNKNIHFIEFWLKGTFKSTCHIDTNEYECEFNSDFKYENGPLLSCVTYFSESNIPTIITDITRDDYLNDNYSEKNKINLSFPRYLKQISFNGGKYYHGTCKIFENETSTERNILSINLWNKKPNKLPYFDALTFHYINYKKFKKEIIDVTIDSNSYLLNITKIEKYGRFIIDNSDNKSIIDKTLFKEFIKRTNGKHEDLFYIFSNILNENNYQDYELIELSNKVPLTNGTEIIEKNIERETKNIERETKNTGENIITKQRMTDFSFFDQATCNWIINSSEKYIMKKKQEGMLLSKINIYSLKNIKSFILFSLENLIKTKILNFYNHRDKYTVKNIHILKLDKSNTNINENNADLTIKIVLNNGLKITFNDSTKIILNKGDLITASSFSIKNMDFHFMPSYILIADIDC